MPPVLAVLAVVTALAAATGPSVPAVARAAAPALAPAGAARPGTRLSSGSVTVTGHGAGHGRGMGQYGAYGYASEAQYRWGYQRIVEHYYGGTHLARIPAGADRASIPVELSELDGATVTTVRAHRPGAELRIDDGPAEAGVITVRHTGGMQTIRATAGDVSVDLPGVGWRTYQGYIEVQAAGAGPSAGATLNVVPIEEYVAGVVPGESPASWGASGGEAALQAQALAARSYALAYVTADGRICDTTACQSYRGDPSTVGLGIYARYSDAATSSTAGGVMCTVAVAVCPVADSAATEYSASTGGYTAGGTFAAVVDAGDAVASNPYHNWSTTLSLATVEDVFSGIGPIVSLRVISRNGHGDYGGRALEVRISGTQGRSVTISGDQCAADFGFYSDWFRFATEP